MLLSGRRSGVIFGIVAFSGRCLRLFRLFVLILCVVRSIRCILCVLCVVSMVFVLFGARPLNFDIGGYELYLRLI